MNILTKAVKYTRSNPNLATILAVVGYSILLSCKYVSISSFFEEDWFRPIIQLNIFLLIKIIAILLLTFSIILQIHSAKELALDAFIILTSFAISFFSSGYELIFIVLLAVSTKRLNKVAFAKTTIALSVLIIFINFTFFVASLLAGNQPELLSANTNGRSLRLLLGFRHPNSFSLTLVDMSICVFYLWSVNRNKGKKLLCYVTPILLSLFIILIATKSFTAIAAILIILLFLLPFFHKRAARNILVGSARFLFPIFSALTILFAFSYSYLPHGVIAKANSLLSGRIVYSVDAIEQNGISLLPKKIDAYERDKNPSGIIVDNLYVYAILKYGIIAVTSINVLLIILSNKRSAAGNRIIIMTSVISLAEKYLLSVSFASCLLAEAAPDNLIRGQSDEC